METEEEESMSQDNSTYEELLAELARAVLKALESSTATDDMMALLCMHLKTAFPDHAASFLTTLQNIRKTELFNKTEAFIDLSQKIEQALAGDNNLCFQSLRKPDQTPTSPEELRARLRLIVGGISENRPSQPPQE